MRFLRAYWPECLIALVTSALFLYRLPSSFVYSSDFGRDSLAMWNILHGDMTLLGPKTSFGGLYTGPYYFYFFAPFLWLFHFHPMGIAVGNALAGVICFVMAMHVIRQKTSLRFALLSSFWIVLTPYFILSGRMATNALSYLPALFLYIVLLVFYYPFRRPWSWLVFGLTAGIIANIHPVALIVIVPFTGAIFVLRRDKHTLKYSFLYLAGLIGAFLPLVLFEVTHHFIMFKNTFLNHSYTLFLSKQNAIVNVQTSTNIFKNLIFMSKATGLRIYPAFIQLVVILTGLFIVLYKKKDVVWIFIFFITNMFFYSTLFRFQATDYYLFPLLVLTQVLLLYFLSFSEKGIQYWLFLVLIIYGLYFFPKDFYRPTPYNFDFAYRQSGAAVKLLPLQHSNFNIVVTNESSAGIVGNEYRYPLQMLGYKADSIFGYADSQQLVIITERGDLDGIHERSWEIDQFGKKKLVKKIKVETMYWYLFKKA